MYGNSFSGKYNSSLPYCESRNYVKLRILILSRVWNPILVSDLASIQILQEVIGNDLASTRKWPYC